MTISLVGQNRWMPLNASRPAARQGRQSVVTVKASDSKDVPKKEPEKQSPPRGISRRSFLGAMGLTAVALPVIGKLSQIKPTISDKEFNQLLRRMEPVIGKLSDAKKLEYRQLIEQACQNGEPGGICLDKSTGKAPSQKPAAKGDAKKNNHEVTVTDVAGSQMNVISGLVALHTKFFNGPTKAIAGLTALSSTLSFTKGLSGLSQAKGPLSALSGLVTLVGAPVVIVGLGASSIVLYNGTRYLIFEPIQNAFNHQK